MTRREESVDWLVGCDEHRLADEIARVLVGTPDASLWRDPRFLDWLAAEAREQDRQIRRRSERELAVRGRAIMARVYARRLGVCHASTTPMLRRPSFAGNPRDAIRCATDERAAPVVDLGVAAGIGRELWDEPVESWLDLPPELPDGDYLALKVSGESMAPLMHTGDTILLKLGSEAQCDTVVVARHPEDGYVCKRVGHVGRDAIDLTSLEPGRAPIRIPRRAELIVGTVLMVWCKHRG